MTTNLAFAEWATVFPNAACTTALIDRVVHHADIIAIEGRATASARPRPPSPKASPRARSRADRPPVGHAHGSARFRFQRFLATANTFPLAHFFFAVARELGVT